MTQYQLQNTTVNTGIQVYAAALAVFLEDKKRRIEIRF